MICVTTSGSTRVRIDEVEEGTTHFIVNICNIHYEVDFISKVIPQNPSHDVLRHVVSSGRFRMLAHLRKSNNEG